MTVPLSRRRAGARNGARLAEQAITVELDRQQAERDEHHAAGVARRAAEREAERARAKFTAADLVDAEFVRDSSGWHRVVRVNAKTITVATAYTWTDRVPIDQVREYRKTTRAPHSRGSFDSKETP